MSDPKALAIVHSRSGQLMKKLRLTTNAKLTNRFPEYLEIEEILPTDAVRASKTYAFWLAKHYRAADCVLIFNPDAVHAAAAMIAKFPMSGRPKVLFFDTNLKSPSSFGDRIRALVKGVLFRSVDVFLAMHVDTRAYTKFFRIPQAKFKYVPFKANNFDRLGRIPVYDREYIFAGGASYRDYGCLVEAVRNIQFPVRIVLPSADLAKFHNTKDPGGDLPPHVTLIRHDGSSETWNKHIAEATFVVLPIRADCIQPAGISVYLEAMALGKAVIISRGASTNGLLDESRAAFYTPGNPDELAAEIRSFIENPARRHDIAKAGMQYALGLEGQDRLSRDLQAAVLASVDPAPQRH
jgi:glycosyltransferase involved in cell wall biosynthesis